MQCMNLYCLHADSTLSFRIRIGGEGGCETADSGEDVVVEYKIGSSTTYAQLKRLASSGNTNGGCLSRD